MSEVEVKPVTSRRDRRSFVDLPWTLYRGDPNWMPPLRMNQEELLGYRSHPFHDNAEVQTFLAWRDGQVCGRIAGIVNREHNRVLKENRGFFGFFESVDDQSVASALFDAVKEWLGESGPPRIYVPANPSVELEGGRVRE